MSFSVVLPSGTFDATFSGTLTLTPHVAAPAAPTPLQLAQATIRRLRFGANLERLRWKELSFNGHNIGAAPEYWAALAALDLSHIRNFLPFGFSGAGTQLTQADVQAAVGLVRNILAGGIEVVFMDFLDVLQLSEAQANDAVIKSYLAMAADVFAQANFPVGRVVYGAVNEPAGDSNLNWRQHLVDYHGTLRGKLPGHVLSFGGANWKYYGKGRNSYDNNEGLATLLPVADDGTAYDVHNYDSTSVGADPNAAATWQTCGDVCAAWSAANGNRPVFCGEFGWVDAAGIGAAVQGMGALRPTAWTITGGTGGRINASATDATLPTATAQAITAAGKYQRAQPYFQAAA